MQQCENFATGDYIQVCEVYSNCDCICFVVLQEWKPACTVWTAHQSSWLPTLHLGYQPSSSDTAKDRYVRLQARKRNIASVNIQFSDKPNVAGNVKVDLAGCELQATSEGSAALVNVSLLEESSTLDFEETDAVPVACAEVIREGGSDEVATADGEQETGIYVQTDLKKLDLEQVLEDCDVRVAESNDRKSIFSVFDMLCCEDG